MHWKAGCSRDWTGVVQQLARSLRLLVQANKKLLKLPVYLIVGGTGHFWTSLYRVPIEVLQWGLSIKRQYVGATVFELIMAFCLELLIRREELARAIAAAVSYSAGVYMTSDESL